MNAFSSSVQCRNPNDDAEDVFLPQSDRLQILSPEEYELPWGLSRFTQDDRDLFFALNPREELVLKRLRTPRTTLHFLLQLSYFLARQRFFRFEIEAVQNDLAYPRRRSGFLVPVMTLQCRRWRPVRKHPLGRGRPSGLEQGYHRQ